MLVTELLDEIGFPYAEGEFRAEVKPPYIAWDRITENVHADGVVVYKQEAVVLHLQCPHSDFSPETAVENVLDEYGISYGKDTQWIGGRQRVWVTTYTLSADEVQSHAEE